MKSAYLTHWHDFALWSSEKHLRCQRERIKRRQALNKPKIWLKQLAFLWTKASAQTVVYDSSWSPLPLSVVYGFFKEISILSDLHPSKALNSFCLQFILLLQFGMLAVALALYMLLHLIYYSGIFYILIVIMYFCPSSLPVIDGPVVMSF